MGWEASGSWKIKRARVLWLDPREAELEVFPVCRECARVEYVTARASELDRAKIAYERLRDRLGLSKHASHERRPHQKWGAYLRDNERLERARQRVKDAEAASSRSLARHLGWRTEAEQAEGGRSRA